MQIPGAFADADDGADGSAGAVGIKPAVERQHYGSDKIPASEQKRHQNNSHVLEQICAVRMAVITQNQCEDLLPVFRAAAKLNDSACHLIKA